MRFFGSDLTSLVLLDVLDVVVGVAVNVVACCSVALLQSSTMLPSLYSWLLCIVDVDGGGGTSTWMVDSSGNPEGPAMKSTSKILLK